MTELRTFQLPAAVTGTADDLRLAHEMIRAWRADGIFQVAATPLEHAHTMAAFEAGKRFFGMPMSSKVRCTSDLSYAGYVAAGEEVTGEADFSEIFAVCPDIPVDDPRVRAQWPCHGPVPWPDQLYRQSLVEVMTALGDVGDRLLQLTALGLGLSVDAITDLTRDGWHHLRLLRFPARSRASARGLGSHTDEGLLVIAAQDDVGGLFVRPPVDGEVRMRNWLPGESSTGLYENEAPWTFVRPVPRVLTVFPGDLLQFMTDGYLLSTPHKVRLNIRERHALTYFHEPSFVSSVRSLFDRHSVERIHYGAHFTSTFMRRYPDRSTTQRILAEHRLAQLDAVTGCQRAA
jgi:isopenicillin N synthase-like dioxygenase